MSTHTNEGLLSESHQRAAELHDGAAHAHRTGAEDHEKQEHETGPEHSRRALEHSEPGYKHAEETDQGAVNEHGFPIFGHEEIAKRAYELWQARGCSEGSAEADWFQAARELRARRERHQK